MSVTEFRRGADAHCVECGKVFAQYTSAHRWCSESCRSRFHYREKKAEEHRKRAYARALMPDDKYQAKRAKEEAWKATHQAQYKAAKRRAHERTHPPKWPVGSTCWVWYVLCWCEGRIVERDQRTCPRLIVELKGGTRVKTGPRWIQRERPADIEVRR